MSNDIFNFNFLALLLSEILGGPKFTLGGPTPHVCPLAENVFSQSEYFTISNCVFNFNIPDLAVSEILGGLKFTLGNLAKIFFVSEESTLLCLMAFLISTF